MVLIDSISKSTKHCHMAAATIAELHEFAAKAGISKSHFHNPRKKNHPHYDLSPNNRQLAVNAGAIEVSSKDIVTLIKQHYKK